MRFEVDITKLRKVKTYKAKYVDIDTTFIWLKKYVSLRYTQLALYIIEVIRIFLKIVCTCFNSECWFIDLVLKGVVYNYSLQFFAPY